MIAFYEEAGGYKPNRPWTDQGVNNPTMIQTAITSGYPVNNAVIRLDGTADVKTTSENAIADAGYNLGGLLLGCSLSRLCYENYGPGQLWDADDSHIVGGHDVYMFALNPQGPVIVTWGKPTQTTWAWMDRFCDEASVLLQIADLWRRQRPAGRR